ncbi:MAG: BPSS1780 family membrane protein [Methylococcales bacterium]
MSNMNPYETPKADLTKPSGSFLLTYPKAVSADRGWNWVAEGFGYFKKDPGAWILTIIVYSVLSLVLSFIPIIGQIALILISDVIMAGFMIGCRAQSMGENFEVKYLFAGFSNNPGRLVLLSIVPLFGVLLVIGIVMGPSLFTAMELVSQPESTDKSLQIAESMKNMVLPFLIVMMFAIPLSMAVLFAPALIALNDQPLIQAMKLSFTGCLKNILPFLLWSIIALILSILGCIPLLLGLLAVVPTLIASIYAAYHDIFIE